MTRVIWSPRALADLDAIEAYIAKDRPVAGQRLVAKIVKRAKRIELFPLSGSIVQEDDRQRYRQILQGNYRVIYRHESAANTAFVITVIHAARLLDPDHL
jgi:toxin ParE1/3/4